MGDYQHRAKVLAELGFQSYRSYLESDLWQSIRNRVFHEKGRVCSYCIKPATQVHHVEYAKANLAGADIRSLRPVCNRCHKKVEFYGRKGTGSKRPHSSSRYMDAKRKRIHRKQLKIDDDRRRRGLNPVYYK